MTERPLSVGIDSQGLGGSHGSSTFKLLKSEVKSVSTAIVAGEDNAGNIVDAGGDGFSFPLLFSLFKL